MPEFGMGGGSATDIPLSKIQELKSQGLTNNEIIQTLQRQGFSSTQIFDSLSQASVQPVATMPPSISLGSSMGYVGSAMQSATSSQPLNTRNVSSRRMDPPPMMGMNSQAPINFDPGSDTEEMIEAIIDEKWNDMMVDINKVIAWKESTEARIIKVEQQMADMKDQFDKLHQAIIGKVGEYDQHILEVGSEVKAIEKVFSKVLPAFTDNVAELSRITDQMKRQPPSIGQSNSSFNQPVRR